MSAIIQTGKIVDVIALLIISASSFFFIWQIKKGLTHTNGLDLKGLMAILANEGSIETLQSALLPAPDDSMS